MIVGIGLDLTEVFRFARATERSGVLERLFTPAELAGAPKERLAARLAELGVNRVFVSITHDAGVAAAMVVCES